MRFSDDLESKRLGTVHFRDKKVNAMKVRREQISLFNQ